MEKLSVIKKRILNASKNNILEISLIIGLVVSVLLSNFTVFADNCNEIRQKSLRLHIIANSNDKYDQELKLKVRDRILQESESIFDSPENLQQAKENAVKNKEEIEKIATEELMANGYDYDVQVKLVNMYFPTRTYEKYTLPAGNYDAVRIEIGKAKGQNWWCVLYPSLCIPSASGKNDLSEIMTKEQQDVIESNPKYEVRFAILEYVEKIKNLFTKSKK